MYEYNDTVDLGGGKAMLSPLSLRNDILSLISVSVRELSLRCRNDPFSTGGRCLKGKLMTD